MLPWRRTGNVELCMQSGTSGLGGDTQRGSAAVKNIWIQLKIFETTRDNLNTKLWLAVMLVLALALLWPLEAASLRNCSQPLGMEDGRILDTQISASSSYQETLVGPDKEASTYSLWPLLSLFFHIVGHPKLSVCLQFAIC